MDTLFLEDFRCFAGRHEVPIRPLTLLVGENSTGKTSFLAAVRAAHDLRASAAPDFNEEPFRLGSYDQIANYRGGRAGRAKAFGVGRKFVTGRKRLRGRARSGTVMHAEAVFKRYNAQPIVSHFSVSTDGYRIQLADLSGTAPTISLSIRDNIVLRRELRGHPIRYDDLFFRRSLFLALPEPSDPEYNRITNDDNIQIRHLIDWATFPEGPRPYAFAPIRTSPQRTYDPTTEVRDPEGTHIPMMLERLLGNGAGSDFRERVEDFGKASGLYSSLGIRKLGRTGSDPFQIEVRPAGGGMARNLIDVGYGVSQAIPIIADCVSAEPDSTLLVQQPEVHLHPRAQAAMGSFFGQLAASERNRLVVETHSDFLVDRVLMDVRDEEIKPSDVIILYFEHGLHGVEIHPIEVDASGRIVEAPDGYRSFFLEEQRRFFGVD